MTEGSDRAVRLPDGWRDVTWLGAGAFGAVYRALDPEGHAVAVKVLDPALAADPDAAWRFGAEYRMLARFDHPGLPRARGQGATLDGAPFYAMDLVAGRELAAERLAPARVRALVGGVADVLAHLHARGYVHRDLKLENVRVDEAGGVRVLDLGLAAGVGEPPEAIAGTPAYMAPEVLRKARLAPAADLYALGVLAYALRTGRLPFEERDPLALLRAHLTAPPPPIHGGEPDSDLDALIAALLAKEPTARPASARAVLAWLAGEAPPPEAPTLAAGPLVGREPVVAAWQAVLAAGRGLMALTGGPGMGKSAALDACRLEARLAGKAWLGASGGGTPGAAARAVIRQALLAAGHDPDARVAAWLHGETPEDLADLEPPARLEALRHAVALAFEAAAAAIGGLAAGLDDWQLVDAASRGMLERCMQASAPVAWLITAVPDAALPASATPIELAPLAPDEVAAWLQARLGGEPPAGLRDMLDQVAAGQPLVLDLLLEHAAAGGALRHEAGAWHFEQVKGEGGSGVAALAPIWRQRVAGLEPAARELGRWIAVGSAAGGVPVPALLAAAGASAEALAMLAKAGLVQERDGRSVPAAPGVAEALSAELSPDARRDRSSRLARELAADQEPDAMPLERLATAARLALAGADDELAVRLAGAAGRRFAHLPAPTEAFEMLDAAWQRLQPGAPGRPRLAFARAEAARVLDRNDDALASYEEVLAAGGADAAAWIGLAKCRQLRGDYEGAFEALGAARQAARTAGRADQEARAGAAEARIAMFRGEVERAQAVAHEALASARASGRPAVQALTLGLLAVLTVQTAPERVEEAAEMLAEAIALSRGIGDRLGEGFAWESLGNVHLAAGDLAAAEQAFEANVAAMAGVGSDVELLPARLAVARVQADRGRHGQAGRLAAALARKAAEAGRAFVQGLALAVESAARWRAGQHEAALAASLEALAVADRIANAYMAAYVRLYRVEALLAAGRDADAREVAEQVAAAPGKVPADIRDRLALARAEVARRSGDLPAARALAEPLAGSPNRWVAQGALALLAELALAAGDAATALEHAEAAEAIAAAWHAPWHEAATRLATARMAYAAGQPERALDLAREAVAAAEGEDANPYALAGAGQLLRELGVAEAGTAAPATAFDPADYDAWLEATVAESDEHRIAAALLRGLMALLRADRGYVLQYDGGRLHGVVAQGLDYDREVSEGFSQTIASQALYDARPVYVVDAKNDAAFREAASVAALELRAVVALPLLAGDEVLGVLYMDREAIEPVVGEADLAMAMAFARTGAGLLLAARARRVSDERAACWEARARIGAELVGLTSAAEARRRVLDLLVARVDATRGRWLRADGPEGSWRVLEARAPGGRDLPADSEGASRGIANWVRERGEPLVLVDPGANEAWSAHASVQALQFTTVWCLPAGDADVIYLEAAGGQAGEGRAEAVAVAEWGAELARRLPGS